MTLVFRDQYYRTLFATTEGILHYGLNEFELDIVVALDKLSILVCVLIKGSMKHNLRLNKLQ